MVLETKDVCIISDPVVSQPYEGAMPRFTLEDLPDTIDYVLITHGHQDHILLETLLQYTGDTEYVFPSPAKQKTPHLSRDALSKALRDLGFQGKHATHGFRGMLRTIGRERLNIDIDVLESQLAHAKKGEVQKAYDRI